MPRPEHLPRLVLALALAACSLTAAAQQRLATDFEIAQMEKQVAASSSFEARVGARLNLGDARAARSERELARSEYAAALDLSEKERLAARSDSSLSRYAVATSWSALANAKLGRAAASFALLEESARYASDEAESWNVAASALRILGYPRKAVAAARNAVTISERTPDKPLDLAVHRHALATALLDAGEDAAAERLLTDVVIQLRSSAFDDLRKAAARQESFEVYSSARGDVAAYVSLLNRSQLRLAAISERRGDAEAARNWYRRVLEARSDEVIALGALARLAATEQERQQLYAEAFDANPFSPALVRDYRRRIAGGSADEVRGNGPGAAMRRALVQLETGELRGARASLDALLAKFPSNETLKALRAEAEGQAAIALPSPRAGAAELRALLANFERISPQQRAALDRTSYTSDVKFDGAEEAPSDATSAVTVLARGMIDGVPFRFASPTAFAGTFDLSQPLRLTYRILGVTRAGDRDVLLLEPERLERAP